jgi:anthranilate/para-aminobenzoate synthase component I
MHLVSNINCDLSERYDAWDLLRASFPAGTLSGAPKVRAMEIIDELEQEPAGALWRRRRVRLFQRQHGSGHHHPYRLH